MCPVSAHGYAGKLLRVDLTKGSVAIETLSEDLLRQCIGGTCLGAKLLYEEVPPRIEWSDPANRLFLASGPLGATAIGGTGTFSVVTKGALTNGATSSQANGFLGAYLRLAGFDGVVFQGAAARPQYISDVWT